MKLATASRRQGRRPARQQQQTGFFGQESESPAFFHSTSEPRMKAENAFFTAKAPEEEPKPKAPEEEKPMKGKGPKEEEPVKSKLPEEEKPVKGKAPDKEEPVKAKAPEEEKPVKAKCGCGCGGTGGCIKAPEAKEPPIKAKAPGESAPRYTRPAADACSPAQECAAESALGTARTMAARAANSIDAACAPDEPAGPPPTELANYERWFGEFNMARAEHVRQTYAAIAGALSGPIEFRCDNKMNLFAYVCPSEPGTIYLGKLFWTRTCGSGRDSHPGILLHELGHHAWGALGDFGYGVNAAEDLARDVPDAAVQNADNYEYYAESI